MPQPNEIYIDPIRRDVYTICRVTDESVEYELNNQRREVMLIHWEMMKEKHYLKLKEVV